MIAALTEQAKERGVPVMVVTGDRDAYQLVDDGVRIMSTSRGVTDTKVYDRQAVIERYGIPPELVPDFIGLKGDTSDNIPGVPGIGDKTAADLLQKFGDLEGVLSSIDQITGAKRKQNLIEHADNARMRSRWRRWSATSRSTSTSRSSSPRRRTAPTCARSSATGSCATRCAGSKRRSRPPSWRRSRAPTDLEKVEVKTGPARNPGDITRLKGEFLVARGRCRRRSPRAS